LFIPFINLMNTYLQQSLELALNTLSQFARQADFWSGFALAFGTDYDRTPATALRQAAIDQTFQLPIQVVPDIHMGSAIGAFSADRDTIYLSQSLVDSGDIENISAVILEEMGHAIDVRVNAQETPGDEGAIFQLVVRGQEISRALLAMLRAEDDWGVISIDGQQLLVEMAATAGNDTITGTSGDDNINGLAGNDSISGGLGNDYLSGDAGVDTLNGGEGNDYLSDSDIGNTFNGGLGNDYINAGVGSKVDGGGDFDRLSLNYNGQLTAANINFNAVGSTGTDTITNIEAFTFYGGDGNDSINAAVLNFDLILSGNGGRDTFVGGSGSDNLSGGIGNDSLLGGAGNDQLSGNEDNDTLDGGIGNDQLYGGIGNDLLVGAIGDDYLYGGDGNDTLNGGDGNDYMDDAGTGNTFNGGLGNDYISAGAGNKVDGGGDFDRLNLNYNGQSTAANITFNAVGSTGTDTIANIEAFTFYGGSGNDSINAAALNFDLILSGSGGQDTFVGGGGNDNLSGNTGNDSLLGGAGNDSLSGNEDNDTLDGGIGNDQLYGGTGNDLVAGGIGNDYLYGGDGNDTLNGGDGDDYMDDAGTGNTFNGGLGNDYMSAGAGSKVDGGGNFDRLNLNYNGQSTAANINFSAVGSTGTDMIANIEGFTFYGGTGNDSINAAALNFDLILSGYGGQDTFVGGGGNDNLSGNTGNDSILGGAGNDSLSGNEDNDTLDGGIGNDQLYGNIGNDLLAGGVGNDYLYGGDGNDTSNGGAGDDYMDSGIGNDVLNGGTGNDYMSGGDNSDQYVIDADVDLGLDRVYESATGGIDTLNFLSTTTKAITFNLAIGGTQLVATGLSLTTDVNAIENAYGGSLADTLIGSASNNYLLGGAGNDSLTGDAGNDTLNGGAGNDALIGGLGTDVFIIDADVDLGADTIVETATGGVDTLDFRSTTTKAVTLDLGIFTSQLVATGVSVTLSSGALPLVPSIEYAYGGSLGDNITGNTLSNYFLGGAGNDTLSGAGGSDLLNGGTGNDSLSGGLGMDRFYFTGVALTGVNTVANQLGRDTVSDFTAAGVNVDKIVLSKSTFGLAAVVNGVMGAADFLVVANDAAITTQTAKIIFSQGSGNLFYNADGATAGLGTNGGSFAVLTGVANLTTGDFVIIA
jgi:Ca2+-binding RTX toxin-like protein